jgi:hypothetical protein
LNDPASPIIHFYPETFDLDYNGKKNSWEAVVKVPFIDQNLLVKAYSMVDESRLTKEERDRNTIRDYNLLYQYSKTTVYAFKSTLPKVFPDIHVHTPFFFFFLFLFCKIKTTPHSHFVVFLNNNNRNATLKKRLFDIQVFRVPIAEDSNLQKESSKGFIIPLASRLSITSDLTTLSM